jgi:hypothetical protein
MALWLQSFDQGTWFVTYTHLIFDLIWSAIGVDPNLDRMCCWKSLTIADVMTLIKYEVDELKPQTVRVCWKILWSEFMNDFNWFLEVEGEPKKIIHAVGQVSGEGLVKMLDKEMWEHIIGHCKMLSKKELEELLSCL